MSTLLLCSSQITYFSGIPVCSVGWQEMTLAELTESISAGGGTGQIPTSLTIEQASEIMPYVATAIIAAYSIRKLSDLVLGRYF